MTIFERLGIKKPAFRAESQPSLSSPTTLPVPAIPTADEVARALITQLQSGEGQAPAAYSFNNPHLFNQMQSPERRPLSPVTVTTLRALADNYPVLRSCIEHLKREVATVPVQIAHRDGDTSNATLRRIKLAQEIFTIAGPVGRAQTDPEHFEQALLEDAMVVGSPAIYHRYSRGGEWLWCDTIDAATIRPVTDELGWEPEGGLYEQWIQGMKVATLTARDLSFDKLASVSWQPYGRSPVEWLIHAINTALRIEGWNLTFFTEGSTVADLLSVPEAWSAEQVMVFTNWWNALNTGNTAERLKTKFVPGGTSRLGSHSARDTDWTPQQLWLLRITCSIMGVQPASIGFTGEQYKVSQDESMHSTSRFGGGVLLRLRKRRYDDILERAGYSDLHTILPEEQTEKPKERAEREEIEIRSGSSTINEVRASHGRTALEGGDVPLVASSLTMLSGMTAPPTDPLPIPTDPQAALRADLKRWEKKSLTRLKEHGQAACEFTSEYFPTGLAERLQSDLSSAQTATDIKALFRAVEDTL
jgi:phage portal protein BeeE